MTRTLQGPESLQDQGIGPHPAESAEREFEALLGNPAIWDIRAEIERTADGRTVRVWVRDGDAETSGEYAPLSNIEIAL